MVLHHRPDDLRPRRQGKQAELLQVLVHLGAIPAMTADPGENGPFETTHRAILVSAAGSVNRRAARPNTRTGSWHRSAAQREAGRGAPSLSRDSTRAS